MSREGGCESSEGDLGGRSGGLYLSGLGAGEADLRW